MTQTVPPLTCRSAPRCVAVCPSSRLRCRKAAAAAGRRRRWSTCSLTEEAPPPGSYPAPPPEHTQSTCKITVFPTSWKCSDLQDLTGFNHSKSVWAWLNYSEGTCTRPSVVDLLSVLERGEETERTPPPPEPQNEEFLHREKERKLHVS